MNTRQFCIIVVLLINTSTIFGQWVEHFVYEASSLSEIVVSDIDSDGYIDIVTTERGHNSVFWYKNDGEGNFSSPFVVGEGVPNLRGIAVGDLTGNGFNDIVVCSSSAKTPGEHLRWYKNTDGNGTFASAELIPEDDETVSRGIVLGDINGDGLLDIVVSATPDSDRSIKWYRNLGEGNFAEGNVIVTGFSNGSGIDVGDIDGDGDLDVISGTSNTGIMSWFENTDGQGTFSLPKPVGSEGYNVLRLHLTDIDGDGDLDVVGNSGAAQLFAWWENLDGMGTFSGENIIETDFLITRNFPADIDSDGDMDVFTVSVDFIRSYENTDGMGTFVESNFISEEAHFDNILAVADIDSNGTMDPVVALHIIGDIYWYENEYLSIPEVSVSKCVLFPNPVGDTLHIQATVQPDKIVIYTTAGQEVFTKQLPTNTSTVDVSFLPTGTYIVEFVSATYQEKQKLVKR